MEFEKLNKTISYLEEFMKNYKFDIDIKDFYQKLIFLKKTSNSKRIGRTRKR